MPSGPKKRKAARRKKEMALRSANPAPLPQDSEQHDDLGPVEDSKESDGGSPASSSSSLSRGNHRFRSAEALLGSEAVAFVSRAEDAESGKGATLAEEDDEASVVAGHDLVFTNAAESVAESEDSALDFAESEKEDEKPTEESAVYVEKIVAITEERGPIDAVAAKIFEETLGEAAVKVVALPDADNALEQLGEENHEARSVDGKAETLPTAEDELPARPSLHHATCWNCCGLLDVFAGSRR
ncbi:hypothetical protein MUK42_13270 [Musa troglodytarum]|uniref:Uncharacterized protein n=1 Tax=Musa troglodytarum TaxID=320322 RepID=A0A9E7HM31_9LILI|nr:hypothetical protein MUK42_13270 [Musa troglodytarum]